MLDNNLAIVTGSAGGNGLAITKQLHQDGFKIVGFDLLKSHTNFFEGEILGSVTDETAIDEVFRLATDLSSNISIVNNAGITMPSEGGYKRELFEKTMDVNTKGPFLFMEKFYELLRLGKISKGNIVNICSLSAHRSFADNPGYIASKHALLGLTRAYAQTLGGHGIRVNSVSPGYIVTDMTAKTFSSPVRNTLIVNNTLLKGWGQPKEIADAVSFLLSEKSNYITGADLSVDGGWLTKGLHD